MTAPFVRVWLLQRAEEIRDTLCDIWYTFRPAINEFWDHVPYAYRIKVPLIDGCDHRGVKVPQPDYESMIGCGRDQGGCGAHIGAPCVTADGHVTRCHKVRRDAARKIQIIEVPS